MSKDPTISERTRAALAAAKERGVKLGTAGADNLRATVEARKSAADAFAAGVAHRFEAMKARGLTHRAMAAELNAEGVAAPRGGPWTHGQVQRMLERLERPAGSAQA